MRLMRPLLCAIFMLGTPILALATPYTPLAWQQVVDTHSNHSFIGQRKHTTWVRDRNRNFIDDEIETRFKAGDVVNVTVDLNRCLTPAEVERDLIRFGVIRHVGQLITFIVIDGVKVTDLPTLAAHPEVAMIEWQSPNVPELDTGSRGIQARRSILYAGQSAEDLNLNGTGINVAVVGVGVDDGTGAYATLPATKFVAGFDATDPTDLGDGTRNPVSTGSNHESVMAVIALGTSAPGHTCRNPNDPQAALECRGIAPGAGLVDVRMCKPASAGGLQCDPAKALDWIGTHAKLFNIRVVLYAFTQCGDDDGTGALAQQANFLVAQGLVFVAATGNAPGPCTMPSNQIGQQLTKQPASGSFVLSVTGSADIDTINRNDDGVFPQHFIGPRNDWNFMNPNLLALKPDLAAPQNLTIFQSGTTLIQGPFGTSGATAVVAGAAALLLQRFPDMGPDSVKQMLLASADQSRNTAYTPAGPSGSWDRALGWGLLNVGAAINSAMTQSSNPHFFNCKTPSTSGPGQLCELLDGKPVWNNSTDIDATTTPQVGVQTTIRAHVKNTGNNPATFLVNFGVYIFSAGNNQFHHIGTKQVTLIAGQDDWVTMDWTPAATNHQCIQVSLAYGLDADHTDNLTQRNFQVLPSQYTLRVENPLFVPAQMEIVAKSQRQGWQCRVSDKMFSLDPFKDCAREVTITFDPPLGSQPGQQADCDVSVYATPRGGKERKVIGGVTVRTYVPRPCHVWGEIVDARGRPVAKARVRIMRVTSEGAKITKASSMAGALSVVTNSDGVFSVPVAPGARYAFTVEKTGLGHGSLTLRPGCGLDLPRLVLSAKGLRAELVRHTHGPEEPSHH